MLAHIHKKRAGVCSTSIHISTMLGNANQKLHTSQTHERTYTAGDQLRDRQHKAVKPAH